MSERDDDNKNYTCCCGCHVHKFTRYYAIITLLLNMGQLGFFIYEAATIYPKDKVNFIFKFIFLPLKFFVLSMLVHGSFMGKSSFYCPALCYFPFAVCIKILASIYYSYICFFFVLSGPGRAQKSYQIQPADMIFVHTGTYILLTWFEIYATRVIFRSHRLLRKDKEAENAQGPEASNVVAQNGRQIVHNQCEEALLGKDGRPIGYNLRGNTQNVQNHHGAPIYRQHQGSIPYNQQNACNQPSTHNQCQGIDQCQENLPPAYSEEAPSPIVINQDGMQVVFYQHPQPLEEAVTYNQCRELPIVPIQRQDLPVVNDPPREQSIYWGGGGHDWTGYRFGGGIAAANALARMQF